MKINILDLIDFGKVDILLEGFNKSTGFVTAILDLDGNVLSKSGWRQICTEFHRINPETSKRCTISDTELAGKLAEGEEYHFYRCLNGLVDVAVPVVINGEHIANLFSGQFFFEEPDRKFFIQQAEKYGFNENVYLEALEKVPVVSKEKVKTVMDFLLNMTQLISEMTFQKLEQTELNRTIKESEEKFKSVFESANVGKSITLPTGEINVNEAFCKMLGYTREELQNKKWQEITPEDEIPIIQKILEPLLKGKKDSARFEKRYICKNGTHVWADVSVSIRHDEIGKPLYFITIIIDITERRRTEEEKQKFVMLAESSSEFIGMCDLDFKPTYVNPSGVRLVGLPDMESACRVKVQDYFFPEDRQFITEEFFPRALRDGHGDIEIRLQHFQTGKAIWMLYYLFSVHDTSGTAIGWATVSRDITDRKQAELELQESENRYRSLFENMLNGYAYCQMLYENGHPADFIYLDVNKAFETLTGLKNVTGRKVSDIIPGIRESDNNLFEIYSRVALTGKPETFEMNVESLNDWYSVSVYSPKKEFFVAVFDVITERKHAEIELQESEERFRKIFEEGPLGMAMASLTTGKLFSVNKALCDMLGFTEEELLQFTFMDITYPDDRDKDVEAVKNLREGLIQKHNTEKRYQKKNGEVIWGARALTKIYSEKDKSYYALAMIEDITMKKMAEEEIIKLNAELEMKVKFRTAQLEASNKELETFTYSVSHDLKAPLRGIDGYSKLLLDLYKPGLNEEAQTFIETIRSSTLQMNQLIDDLLDYSRLERSQLSTESIKINDLIKSVLSIYKADLEAGNFKMNMNIADIELIADSKGLTIALRNLLENAIKFTRGKVDPLIQIKVEEKDLSWMISIHDNGIGFDMQYHQKIFEIFQRLQRVEDFPGTGIGLAMVSKAMQRMNGRAWADSTPGMGSTFYLEIPKNQ